MVNREIYSYLGMKLLHQWIPWIAFLMNNMANSKKIVEDCIKIALKDVEEVYDVYQMSYYRWCGKIKKKDTSVWNPNIWDFDLRLEYKFDKVSKAIIETRNGFNVFEKEIEDKNLLWFLSNL